MTAVPTGTPTSTAAGGGWTCAGTKVVTVKVPSALMLRTLVGPPTVYGQPHAGGGGRRGRRGRLLRRAAGGGRSRGRDGRAWAAPGGAPGERTAGAQHQGRPRGARRRVRRRVDLRPVRRG